MQLKKYQQKAIEDLSEYLKKVEETDPKTAFIYAA